MNTVSVQDAIEEAVDYARTYLSLVTQSYRRIWYKLHTCPNSGRWPNILLLCELVFSLPFTTCRVEQMFSLLRVVKTKCRTNLQTSILHDLVEISIEGPPLSDFNADAAIKLWWSNCFGGCRVKQKERKEYTPRACSSAITEEDSNLEDPFALDDWDQLFSDI